jgi:CBS domain-containing protein
MCYFNGREHHFYPLWLTEPIKRLLLHLVLESINTLFCKEKRMLKSVKVADYMTRQLITFYIDTPLFEAIKTFSEHQVSGAPVVDKAGRLVGVMSEVDCLRGILNKTYHKDEIGGTVGDFMTIKVDTVTATTDIIAVAEQFIHRGRRRIPVVEGDKLIGQVSRKDILRAVNDFICKDYD